MGSGYILNFNDRTFRVFFEEHDIHSDAEMYKVNDTAKLNSLRTFWKIADNDSVGKV